MKKITKKSLSLLLSLMMVLSLFAGVNISSSAASVDDLGYEVWDGKVVIVACVSSASGELVIPDTIDGYPIGSIDSDVFYNHKALTSITFPNGIDYIPSCVCQGCDSLKSVYIPDSVESINGQAFMSCISLTDVVLPGSLTDIGADVFMGCASLTDIKIPDSVTSIGSLAFFNTALYNNTDNWINGVLYIDNCLIIADNTLLGSNCKIKDGTRVIADSAFAECGNLKEITIPDTVTNIGSGAFSNTGLTDIYFRGTREMWRNIQVESNNDDLRKAEIHFLGNDDESGNTIVAENGITVEFENGTFPDNIQVSVTADEIIDGDAFVVLREHKNNNKAQLFDINIVDENGNKVQPNGEVLVKIPMPHGFQKNATGVYYISPDGNLEKLESYCEDGYVYFKTNHFSTYAIVEELPENDNDHDNDWSIISLMKRGWEFLKKIFNFIKKLFGA